MTPTQLRAYLTVVRCGSVKSAAAELEVSEAAISLHVGKLRKEFGDQLFLRTSAGLAFTPGGLRLASRASELLGLQDRTLVEVSQAGSGKRLLRVAASSLFAEYAAPGLIELFVSRAHDLHVELSVHSPHQFTTLLHTRTVDIAIGPRPPDADASVVSTPFFNYQVIAVVGPQDPLAKGYTSPHQLRRQTWLLGPSAAHGVGVVPSAIRQLRVPEEQQRIFQSNAAALEQAKSNNGVALVVAFSVTQDLANGRLVKLEGSPVGAKGSWATMTLPDQDRPAAASELVRFVSTPRALQAMLRGPGVNVGRFRPAIHVTLWS